MEKRLCVIEVPNTAYDNMADIGVSQQDNEDIKEKIEIDCYFHKWGVHSEVFRYAEQAILSKNTIGIVEEVKTGAVRTVAPHLITFTI